MVASCFRELLYHVADCSFYMAVFICCTGVIRKADLWENFVKLEGFCKKSTKTGVKFLHPLDEFYIFFVYEKAPQMLYLS